MCGFDLFDIDGDGNLNAVEMAAVYYVLFGDSGSGNAADPCYRDSSDEEFDTDDRDYMDSDTDW